MRNRARPSGFVDHVNDHAAYYARHYSTRRHEKARFWVWIIASTVLIILVSCLSNFMTLCKQAGVFTSLTFKFAIFFFLVSLFLGGFILHISGEYEANKPRTLWRYHKIFFSSAILSVVICIVLFTVSLYPAYDQACIAYGCLAAIFITNLGCMLLY